MTNQQLLRIVLNAVRDAADAALSSLTAEGGAGPRVEAPESAKSVDTPAPTKAAEPAKVEPAKAEPEEVSEPEAPPAGAGDFDINEASRPELVKYIKDNGLDETPEFLESVGTLVRTRRTKLVTFLEQFMEGGGRVQSQQASPIPTEPEAQADDTVVEAEIVEDEPPPKTAKAVNGLDNESIEKAEQMIGAFNDWLKDGETSPDVQAFWSKWGCDGNCLAHDKASIDRCYERLSA